MNKLKKSGYFEHWKEILTDREIIPEYEWHYLKEEETEELIHAFTKKKADSERIKGLLKVASERARIEIEKQRAKEEIYESEAEWEKRKRKTTWVGNRLEIVVSRALKDLKQMGEISSYKGLPPNKQRPDFIMESDNAIECKNWNPDNKNDLNPTTIKRKILERFHGDKKWVKNTVGKSGWSEKILVIPEVKYGYKQKKCRQMMKDIEVIEGFSWVSPDPDDFSKAEEEIGRKFRRRILEDVL